MRQIAAEADLDTNGVSQSIGSTALSPFIDHVPHEGRWRGGDEVYRVVEAEGEAQEQLF